MYTPDLQELNNNHIKYGRAYGMMKKVINLALATNSYEELIGMCQDFLTSKQEIIKDQNQAKEVLNNKELDVTNPVITVRKGRPAGKVKSVVEIHIRDIQSSSHIVTSCISTSPLISTFTLAQVINKLIKKPSL